MPNRRIASRAFASLVLWGGTVLGDGWERPDLPGLFTRISAAPVEESSGIVPSRAHEGLFWTHNDSGDKPRLFAIRLDGTLAATYKVEGANAKDWEDIAISAEGALYIADVGNNNHGRDDLVIYKVQEPTKLEESGTIRVEEEIPVEYPDQNYNCEALFLDEEGRLNLITKDPPPAKLFRFEGEKGWRLQQVLTTQDLVTGADLSADGKLAISTYLGYVVFTRDDAGQWVQANRLLAVMEQCEAVCWYNDALFFTSEQRGFFRFQPGEKQPSEALFERYAWDPTDPERTYTPLGDGQVRAESLSFRFRQAEDSVQIVLAAPWEKHSGRAVFLFSSRPPGERIHVDRSEHKIEVVRRDEALTLRTHRFSPPGRKNEEAKLPVWLSHPDEKTLVLEFASEWIDRQHGFAAYFFGFDEKTIGWPYSYYRINNHPLLWAEREGREE